MGEQQTTFESVQEYREYNRSLVEEIMALGRKKAYAMQKLVSSKYRHYHIAYCMLRGTPYEKIEQRVRENNEPNWTFINILIEKNDGLKHVPRERRESPDHNVA